MFEVDDVQLKSLMGFTLQESHMLYLPFEKVKMLFNWMF